MALRKTQRASTPVYVGFSTFQQINPPYTIIDVECVKQDLLNVFHTKLGERVMLPEFGSRIHEVLFDPFDDVTRQAILDDIERVIATDPRVTYDHADVTEFEYGIRIEIQLTYTPGDTAETLFVEFVRDGEDAL